jgi:hypothetical protein
MRGDHPAKKSTHQAHTATGLFDDVMPDKTVPTTKDQLQGLGSWSLIMIHPHTQLLA